MFDKTELETPHSGYHWNHLSPRYFEGWYYRLTLPEIGQTFAFMYSIEDPLGEQANSGGAVQILGIEEQYLCRTFPDVKRFFAAKDRLSFGHWGKSKLFSPQPLSPKEFATHIEQGYQATATLNQGCIYYPNNQKYCRWQYQIQSVYGWGNPRRAQQATAGWLSYLPVFEPGWQVLMAHGLATGWIDWQGQIYHFTAAPAYSEKNWGSSFPQKWFWINCNSFDATNELTITAVGGIRDVFWWQEEVGLIGIHYQGQFYEFAPGNSQISWQVNPWGYWQMQASNRDYQIVLVGTTDLAGTYVRVPTAKGLVFNCRDTTKGQLSITLRSRYGKTILQANSERAGLEIGGLPWNKPWIVNKRTDITEKEGIY